MQIKKKYIGFFFTVFKIENDSLEVKFSVRKYVFI